MEYDLFLTRCTSASPKPTLGLASRTVSAASHRGRAIRWGILVDWDVEQLCDRFRSGDTAAIAELWPNAYDELRKMARGHLRLQRGSGTLDTVGLVNDAYLRLEKSTHHIASRSEFLALCSTIMRGLVIDTIRSKARIKRGGDLDRVTLATATPDHSDAPAAVELLDLETALESLNKVAPRLVHLVEMKFYGGLTNDEIAAALDVSKTTVKREWLKARTLLHELLAPAQGS